MNKQQLINFINDNYEDDELLIFQTISFSDIEPYLNTINAEKHWEEFVEYESAYSIIASDFTNSAVERFDDFVKAEDN